MIDGKKLIDKRQELKAKYCKYWDERPDRDTYSGPHGFIEMILYRRSIC